MKAFVIARDRVSYAQQCVAALLAADLEVHIVDHGSTYLPMHDWLFRVTRARGRLGTVHWKPNTHPRNLWSNGTLAGLVMSQERFIVTDCDVVPDAPPDWVGYLDWVLDKRPGVPKVGLGLRTDDLPDHFRHAERVRRWESQWTEFGRLTPIDWSQGYLSPVDTTLAMYRRLEPFALEPAIRTGYPYLARHLPWYEDTDHPTDEQIWYRDHATAGVSHWLDPVSYERS